MVLMANGVACIFSNCTHTNKHTRHTRRPFLARVLLDRVATVVHACLPVACVYLHRTVANVYFAETGERAKSVLY